MRFCDRFFAVPITVFNKKVRFDARSGCGDTCVLHTHFLGHSCEDTAVECVAEGCSSTPFCTFARAGRQQALCVALVSDHTVCSTPPRCLKEHAKDVRHHPAQSVLFNRCGCGRYDAALSQLALRLICFVRASTHTSVHGQSQQHTPSWHGLPVTQKRLTPRGLTCWRESSAVHLEDSARVWEVSFHTEAPVTCAQVSCAVVFFWVPATQGEHGAKENCALGQQIWRRGERSIAQCQEGLVTEQ